MNLETFNKLMEFCGYLADDSKRKALQLVMVGGLSQRAAASVVGYNPSQLNQVYTRVRREIARVEKLIGGTLQ